MKWAHSVTIKVFVYPDDDIDEIKKTLKMLVPLDDVKLEKSAATGLKEEEITIFKIKLQKERHIKKFLSHLISKLTEPQKTLLLEQKESRLDEHNNFFIRLSKPDLRKEKYKIIESGDCYHIRIHIAAFPATRDKSLEAVMNMLTQT